MIRAVTINADILYGIFFIIFKFLFLSQHFDCFSLLVRNTK